MWPSSMLRHLRCPCKHLMLLLHAAFNRRYALPQSCIPTSGCILTLWHSHRHLLGTSTKACLVCRKTFHVIAHHNICHDCEMNRTPQLGLQFCAMNSVLICRQIAQKILVYFILTCHLLKLCTGQLSKPVCKLGFPCSTMCEYMHESRVPGN